MRTKQAKNKSLAALMKENNSGIQEAKSFSAPIELSSKHVTVKLPRSVLKYLNLDTKQEEIKIVPINNTLQIVNGNFLTFPALDMDNLEKEFVQQPQ